MKKLISFYVKKQTLIRDYIAIILFKLNLIPNEYKGRARALYKSRQYNKKFLESKLKYNELGFYSLDPMPTEEFLKKYYAETYWQSRGDKNFPIRLRDVEHYKLLKKTYPDFDNSPKKILNFGAGHGGLSILLYVAKHKIYNFEPGQTNPLFTERWNSLANLEGISDKFDLIYGSHTLEHVQDIKKILKIFNNISHEKTIFFFEVPNCSHDKRLHPPHTYYFTRKFFYNYFYKYDFCQTFKGSVKSKDDEGSVIRFLSNSKINEDLLN